MDDLLNPVPASSADPDSDTDGSGTESLHASSLHSDSSFGWDSDGDEAASKFASTDGIMSPRDSELPHSSAGINCSKNPIHVADVPPAPTDVDMHSMHSSEQSAKSQTSVKSALMDGVRKLTQTVLGKRRDSVESFNDEVRPAQKYSKTGTV
jgi:hypothetical protein